MTRVHSDCQPLSQLPTIRGFALHSSRVYEHSLIAAFVKRSKRDRYREILSDPRLRHKFTAQLAHFSDFDPKYRLSIPSNKLFVDNIARELQKRHSPSVVFAISEDPTLDQKELPAHRGTETDRRTGHGRGPFLHSRTSGLRRD